MHEPRIEICDPKGLEAWIARHRMARNKLLPFAGLLRGRPNVAGGGGPAPPAAPTISSITVAPASLSVAWGAVTGATSYNVYRGTSSGAETLLKTGATSPYVDAGQDGALTAGTTYFYQVTAVNGSGESAKSNEVSGATAAGLKGQYNASLNVYSDLGTTPVTNLGTVEQENDQTALANNVTQTTGANRPTWQSSFASGLPFVVYPGGSSAVALSNETFPLCYPGTMFVRAYITNGKSVSTLLRHNSTSIGTNNGYKIDVLGNGSVLTGFRLTYGGVNFYPFAALVPTLNTDTCFAVIVPGNNLTATGYMQVAGTVTTDTAAVGVLSGTPARLDIGADQSTNDVCAGGIRHALIYNAALSDTQVRNILTWMAAN